MRVSLTALLAATIVVLAGCGGSQVPPFEEARELVVLTRVIPTTYIADPDKGHSGFEYELVTQLGQSLGLPVRFVTVGSDLEIYRRIKRGKAHMAAAWLSRPIDDAKAFAVSQPFYKSDNVLLQHEAALPADALDDLAGKTLHVAAGSQIASILYRMQAKLPTTRILERPDPSGLGLAEAVAQARIDFTVVDEPIANMAQNFYPQLQAPLRLGRAQDIVWVFPADVSPALKDKVNAFLLEIGASGKLGQLADRYFAHTRRLTGRDAYEFIARIKEILPKYQPLFVQAQVRTGIDWRLLAALAYQESHWDPLATSFTNVRGMMMLTEDTADRMGVKNRLDPQQSIYGGADYLKLLLNELPDSISEPDRTWFALAAYNLGMGHLNGARAIAKGLKVNPDRWFEMKTALPLLSRPEYYSRLKSGRGRGGEAVILTENIRAFYDILVRYAPAYAPAIPVTGSPPGLRPGGSDALRPPPAPQAAGVNRSAAAM